MRLNKDWRIYLLSLVPLLLVAGATACFLPDYRNLILLLLYSAPSNSFIAIPHEPAVILFGRFYAPELVAFAAIVGTLEILPLLVVGSVMLIVCFLFYRVVQNHLTLRPENFPVPVRPTHSRI